MGRHLTTVLDAVGAACLVTAAALVYVPAAFAVAGVGLLAASWKLSRQ